MKDLPEFEYLWQYLDYWANKDEGYTAIKYGSEEITYGEFKRSVDSLAGALLEMGVSSGDRIATVLPMRPEYAYTYLASSKIGSITVPMDVRYRKAELSRFLSHAEPEVVIAIDSFADNNIKSTLNEVKADIGNPEFVFLNSEPYFNELLKHEPIERPLSKSPDEDILIIFTGGTTGVPKATLLSHKNVISMCIGELSSILAYFGKFERYPTLVHLPPSHVGGTTELLSIGVLNGSKMIFIDHWRPDVVLKAIQDERIPYFGAVPTMFAMILSMKGLEDYDLSSLELLVTAGERLNPELIKRMQKLCQKIAVGYGSTETTGFATFSRPDDDIMKFAEGYVGVPFEGVEIKIVDDSGKELGEGDVGEILVKGPMVSKGYFRQPGETEKGFTDGFWVSGDLGYLKGDELYIIGRKKEIIRVGSYTVLPMEVEEIIMKDQRIAAAAVIGMPHEIYGEVVWAVVVPKPGETVSEEEIIESCKKELADFKVPRKVIVRESIPMTRLGKADRIRLKDEIMKEISE
jgi:acyl-CoA synthetase (AMP-forming)/AMP-acid ligase II